MSVSPSTVAGRRGRCRVSPLRRLAIGCGVLGVLVPTAAAAGPRPHTPAPPPPVPTVTVPAGLPAVDQQCVQGSWSAPAAALGALVGGGEHQQTIVAAANVLNVVGTTYTWEASYTIEQLGAAPPGTVPMPEVVSQTEIWWLQSGDLLAADATVSFVSTTQSSAMPATRVFIDGAWMSFPGSGEPPVPALGTVSARCTEERLELYVPVANNPGATVLIDFDRYPSR